ncbi:hypothetical protein EMEDMD4_510055 [Sinorhizobium medicae]|uniref:Uncharacterized protein n=1 Tax=Sinorhizobium medicae TaxID=110321 RepID=A0A508X1H9_9HYPH|nr:hypothetical protein EMEDMD4_510055 [Sinorhizobium medicae]
MWDSQHTERKQQTPVMCCDSYAFSETGLSGFKPAFANA